MTDHLAIYAGLMGAAGSLFSTATPPPPGPQTRQRIADVLGFSALPAEPAAVRTERRWRSGGLEGEEVTWSVGYGPRTRALVVRPEVPGRLPGVLALHSHDMIKRHGLAKIADGPDGPPTELAAFRAAVYGGRAYANELARRGFVVVAHDVFLWGSRAFPLEVMQESTGCPAPDYEQVARQHEHVAAKYATALGTSIAAIVAHEDRVALAYLRSRSDVATGPAGIIGLSGGGCRAALLRATADRSGPTVITGMMTSYRGLLERHIAPHTWMLFPPGLARFADWPDVAASAAPLPLLVQYLRSDQLFTRDGMEAADRRLAAQFARAGAPEHYAARWHDGDHRFDVPMQEEAFDWLADHLTPPHP